jgi:uncharacterized protein YkwD
MKRLVAAAIVALSSAPVYFLFTHSASASEVAVQTNQDFTNRVIELTNQERSKAGLSALKFESRLATAALRHSEDMALQDYFRHTQPNGGTLSDRINATGYQF